MVVSHPMNLPSLQAWQNNSLHRFCRPALFGDALSESLQAAKDRFHQVATLIV
jgi:hypothetical protein